MQKIANKILKLEEQKHFLLKLGQRVGVPLWSSCKFQIKPKGSVVTETENQGVEVVVPLTHLQEESVNGFLICTITINNVDVDLYENTNYESFGFDLPNGEIDAEDIAIGCMLLESEIYEHATYRLLDDRLFAQPNPNPLPKSAPTEIEIVKSSPIATEVIIMITYHHCTHTGSCAGGTCDECNYCVSTELLVTNVWDNFGGGGFGGGAGAGDNGGGGSGGGGSSGWAYTPPPPPPTIPSLPTDSVIKKIATAVSSKSDSMFNYANQPSVNKERGVIIVEKNGAIYYKNEVEGDENSCKINYQLDPGERLRGGR